MPSQGYESIKYLINKVIIKYGEDKISLLGELNTDCDAIGWKLEKEPGILFSVSTHASELPFNYYDFQISILDDTLDNGEILFLDEVDSNGVLRAIDNLNRNST